VLCSLAAGLVSFLIPPEYHARALVATVKTATDVSFGSGIESLSEDELASIRFVDPKARIQSYIQIASNPEIAAQVIEMIGDQLPDDLRDISGIIQVVDAEIAANSDSIAIIVKYVDPEIAALIANAWADAYIAKVNAIYSSGETQASYDSIQRQTAEAQGTYETAQNAYVEFLGESRVNEYTRQVLDLTQMVELLSTTRSLAAGEIITGTLQANLIAFNQGIENAGERLSQAYEQHRKNVRLLQDAQDMRDQVAQGGPGAVASNLVALTLLKTQAYADNEVLTYLQLNTETGVMTQDEMLADLQSLVATLEARQVSLDEEITGLTDQLAAGVTNDNEANQNILSGEQTQTVVRAFAQLQGLQSLGELSAAGTPLEEELQDLAARINELNGSLAAEQAREQELLWARDLARGTYETLAKKGAELGVALQTKGTDVALASPAMIPTQDTVSVARNVLMAALVGFFLGIFAAYAIEFWWAYKGVEPRAVTFRMLLGRESN